MTVDVIGLDIGGSKLAAALVDPDGRVSARAEVPSPADQGPDAMIAAAAKLVNDVQASALSAGARPVALGVATAGVVKPGTGWIRSAVGTIKDWTGVPVGPRLTELTGLPAAVENDVNAMALAEVCCGAAKGARSALVVAAGTGIGGAIVMDGELRRGRTGTAGEIGHIPVQVDDEDEPRICSCGRTGHLEALAAGPAIETRYASATGQGSVTTLPSIGRAGRAGDAVATAVIGTAGAVLGRAIGGLCNVLDPDVVVLAGGVIALGSILLDPLTSALRGETLPGPTDVTVQVSSLGENAGIVGAGIAARQISG
jgi:glucokinase